MQYNTNTIRGIKNKVWRGARAQANAGGRARRGDPWNITKEDWGRAGQIAGDPWNPTAEDWGRVGENRGISQSALRRKYGRGFEGFSGEEKYYNFEWKNIFAPHTLLTGKSGKNIFEPHTYLGGKSILAPHTYLTNEKGQNILTPHTYLPGAEDKSVLTPAQIQALNPTQAQAQEVPLGEEETRIIEAQRIEREDAKVVLKEKLKGDIMNEMGLSIPPESEGMSMGKKIGFGLAGVVVLVGIGYLLGGGKTKVRRSTLKRR